MTPNDCAGELNTLLPDGLTGTVEIDRALDGDYALRVQDGRVAIRASRLRHALCALGDVARAVRSGRPLRDKVVRSPLTCRMIEAWAPMHSHMFLPLPEYHEHSWHFRLREYGGVEVSEAEVDMAITRFAKYVKLVAMQGFTHIVLDDQDYLPLFPRHPEIYPVGGDFHQRHTIYRRLFRRLIDIAAAHDLAFVLFCQEIGYTPPTRAFFGEICPRNPALWAHLDEKYDEIIEAFPDIEGYMVKVSDSFLSPDNLYHHRDLFRHECAACRDMSPLQRVKSVVDHMVRVVVGKHGRNLYYRTWDVNHGIHVDIEKHRALFAGVDDPRVHPMLKYTRGDFQISNPFHPGIGGMPHQVVEYQFKLEHDGHGVLPLYIGAIHEQSLRENIARGVTGIWGWPSGGGRASINNITHFKGFTRFAEMNQFVFAGKMMEPEVPHADLLAMWGEAELGRGNGQPLASILDDLTEAFRLMGNFGELWTGGREYARSSFHHGWFYDWHAFRHGGADMRNGARVIRENVLPFISDVEQAVARMHRGATLFRRARERFEAEIKTAPGREHEQAAFHGQFLAAEAFAGLCALWVEALLRFYSGRFSVEGMNDLLARLEAARARYDRNYGVFVTQCMDYFIVRARQALAGPAAGEA